MNRVTNEAHHIPWDAHQGVRVPCAAVSSGGGHQEPFVEEAQMPWLVVPWKLMPQVLRDWSLPLLSIYNRGLGAGTVDTRCVEE